MDLIYENDYNAAYSGSNFGSILSKGPNSRQNFALADAFKKYDITTNRIAQIIGEVENISTYPYMNMNYLAAAFNIMETFEDFEAADMVPDTKFNEYMIYIFSNESVFTKIYYKITDKKYEKNQYYTLMIKRVLLSYCFKIFKSLYYR